MSHQIGLDAVIMQLITGKLPNNSVKTNVIYVNSIGPMLVTYVIPVTEYGIRESLN